MNINKIRIWLKEFFNTSSMSIKNVSNSSISVKVNRKEKVTAKKSLQDLELEYRNKVKKLERSKEILEAKKRANY